MQILLVDDEVELVHMLARFLKVSGLSNVNAVYTPEAALEFVEQYKPDMVVLDINLNSVMTGIDVLKRIREISPETQVCMSSAYREEHEAASLALGARWFLKKPARIQDFLSIIRSVQQ